MRPPLLLVSILLITAASATSVVNAQTAEAGWRVTPRSSPDGERLFIDPASTLLAMVTVRESSRSVIDAPSLGAWLTRMAQADPPIAGTRWFEPGKLIGGDEKSAQFARVYVSTDGLKGFAMYGAATADGRQGRIIRAMIADGRDMNGPVGAKVQKLFMELMLAEVSAGQKSPPVPARVP